MRGQEVQLGGEREEVSEACTGWLANGRMDGRDGGEGGGRLGRLWERDVHLGVAAAREPKEGGAAAIVPPDIQCRRANGRRD